MKTAFMSCAAAAVLGLATVATPALAQNQVTPKSGPDVNQPKYVPGSSGNPSTTGAAGKEAPTNNAGGGNGGGSSGGAGAGAGGGAGSGSSGAGAGGGAGSGTGQ